ncbi:MAG: hypothetical protein KUG54_01105, partial [Gammaproteobacteria bacterium]|nr:hypothetical protein [Gammaproteobacteria bacterium]
SGLEAPKLGRKTESNLPPLGQLTINSSISSSANPFLKPACEQICIRDSIKDVGSNPTQCDNF